MKLPGLLKAALIVLVVVGLYESPQAKTVKLVGTGILLPIGQTDEGWRQGFHFMAGGGKELSRNFSFIVKFEIETMPVDWGYYSSYPKANLSVFLIGGEFILSSPFNHDSMRPILMFGAGLGRVMLAENSVVGTSTFSDGRETRVFADFGVGVELKTGVESGVSILARAVALKTSAFEVTVIPLTLAVRFR